MSLSLKKKGEEEVADGSRDREGKGLQLGRRLAGRES